MTLDELTQQLVAKLGEKGRELATLYGPTALNMAQEDVQKWLDYVFVGRYTEAYELYIRAKSDDDLLSQMDSEHAAWVAANNANADRIEMANRIALEMAKAMLSVFLALVAL